MSFFRTIIADAQPRKSMLKPSGGPPVVSGREIHGMDRGISISEYPQVSHQAGHLSISTPAHEDKSDINIADTPIEHTENPLKQDIQDVESHRVPQSPVSVSVDKSEPISDERNHAHLDTGTTPNWEPTNNEDKTSTVEKGALQQVTEIIHVDNSMNSSHGEQEDVSPFDATESYGNQSQTTDHYKIETDNSPILVRNTIKRELTSNDDESSKLQAEEGIGQPSTDETIPSVTKENASVQREMTRVTTVDKHHLSENSIKDQLSEQPPTSAKPIVRNEPVKTLVDDNKTAQTSAGIEKQTSSKILSNQDNNHQNRDADEPKIVSRNIQPVPHQVKAKPSHGTTDTEHASVSHSAGTKVPTTTRTPNPVSAKHASNGQETKPLLKPEALRTVPAKPFQTDSMPKAGESVHSRPQLRSPEKKLEPAKVHIGQIDVIIEAPSQPVAKQVPAPTGIDLASRHYLRRL